MLLTLLAVLGTGALLLAFREWYINFRYNQLSKHHGCTPPLSRSHFPLGISEFFKIRKAVKQNTLLEFFHQTFENTGRNTFRAEINSVYRVLTRDPENIKTVLATNFKDYSLGRRYFVFFPLLGNGIFTLSGEGWKHSRNLLRPQFSRQQVSHLDSLHGHVNALLDIFKNKSKSTVGTGFDCQVLFHCLTLDTATEFLFGESVDSLGDGQKQVQSPGGLVTAGEFAECFNYSLTQLALRSQAGKFYWLVNSKRFRDSTQKCKNFVDHFVYKALENQKHEKNHSEFSYVFIEELAKQTSDPVVIRDQAFNILLAGRDTTASLLSFVIRILAQDKRVWNKLRDEVLETFGTDTSNISFESLKRSSYLNHVVNEVLRLCPIVPNNARAAIHDTILPRGGGPDQSQPVFVPKGSAVFYSIYSMHHNKEYWGEDADEFRPERWEEGKLHMWDYLPFNGGPRICLGQQFALTEATYTIVRILQTFKDVHLTPSRATEPKFLQLVSLTASVAGGVPVWFEEV
jgi:cytochrome P450